MAVESLVYYLNRKTAIDKDRLYLLFKPFDTSPEFKEHERVSLLKALDELKILDPACGSGAFPMGILMKITGALRILDKDAKWWKQRQIEKIDNAKVRQDMQEKLDTATVEYARKIGIIQNTLYGVDIQPIAAEISKLRCFLTLIVDENIDDSKPNRGVEPLPNLEFKFVTADSLVKLPETTDFGGLFGRDTTYELAEKLKQLRIDYMQSYGKRKQQIKNDFLATQKKICELHTSDSGIDINSREYLISTWNPFTNEKSDWFDPEWMFGVKDGFDIVIGNPPYGATLSEGKKTLFRNIYNTAKSVKDKQKGSLDSFTLFIERGYDLIIKNGNLHYIVPIAVTSSDSMSGLHKLMEDNCELIKISSFAVRPKPIFQNAVVNTSILFFIKTCTANRDLMATKMYRKNDDYSLAYIINNLEFISIKDYKLIGRYPKISYPIEQGILTKLNNIPTTIGELITKTGNPIYYRTTGGRYFKVITNYPTYSTKEKPMYFDSEVRDLIGAILSSNLFFWYYQIYSNNLDLKSYEVESFRVPKDNITPEISKDITAAYEEYLIDIEKNSNIRQTNNYANISSYKEYKIGKSKHLIDKIDKLIAPLYGLTEEEADFIINYELEFRLRDKNE